MMAVKPWKWLQWAAEALGDKWRAQNEGWRLGGLSLLILAGGDATNPMICAMPPYAAVCRRMPPWDPTNSYILTLTAGRPQQPLKASILCRLTDFGLRLISYDIIYQWLSRHPQQWTLLRQPPCALQDSRGLPAGRSTAWSRGFPVAFKFAWRRYWKECQRLPVLETLV